MRSACSYRKYIALTAILVLVISTIALANGVKVKPAPPAPVAVQPTQCPMCGMPQGLAGAGPRVPMACASSVGQTAYFYSCNFRTTKPMATTGSMQMTAIDTSQMRSAGPDTANIVATFTYPPTGGSQYRVEFTSVDATTDFGGVALLQPVFGETGACAGYNLPETLAYAAAIGNATIMKDGVTIATDQPAFAAVTQALHGNNQNWLPMANPDAQEIHLIVPGSMAAGGTAVPGFDNGGFYVYWPSAALELRNIGGAVELAPGAMAPGVTPAVPGARARGPEGFGQPLGTISMSITNDGIQKAIGTAPFGPYVVRVTNNSSRSRGLVLTGVDLAGNEFVRYTPILRSGQSTSFQYYFAPGKLAIRDFLGGQRTATAYTNVKMGGLSTSIVFQ